MSIAAVVVGHAVAATAAAVGGLRRKEVLVLWFLFRHHVFFSSDVDPELGIVEEHVLSRTRREGRGERSQVFVKQLVKHWSRV